MWLQHGGEERVAVGVCVGPVAMVWSLSLNLCAVGSHWRILSMGVM